MNAYVSSNISSNREAHNYHQDIAAYPINEWNSYARLFASIMTPVQRAVYRESCRYLSGNIVDCGCGSAKIAPFLAEEENISSYTGIDYAKEMVSVAQWLLDELRQPAFTVQQSRIEDVSKYGYFSSGVSIQSYYSWPDPVQTLMHIFNILRGQAIFVLATPNKTLSIEKLLAISEKELLGHPDWKAFKDYNLKLAHNPDANFVSMDTLIRQVQEVGFQIMECHQRHFEGGLNFLVLRKGGSNT